MNMTSNCDVTNSAHQIKMTTICHWMKNPWWKFSAYATVRSTCHKCDKCVRVGYIFYYEASQIQNINRMSGEALSTVSDLLPLTYWYWCRNDSVRGASTTGIMHWFVINLYFYCAIISMTRWLHSPIFLFLSCQSVFYTPFYETLPRVVTFFKMARWSKVVWPHCSTQ